MWKKCTFINQCFIKELSDCKKGKYLITYETLTGKKYVKEVTVYHGRVECKTQKIIAYMEMPKPYCGDFEK